MTSFITDEHIPRKSVEILRGAGYDVLSIGDDFTSLNDVDILALANETGRIVITCDSDFGDSVFKQGLKCFTGIIYLRLGAFRSNEPGEIILGCLKLAPDQFAGRFSVLDRTRIRQTEL